MSLNFSKIADQNLTFAQLESLISQWAVDTDECSKQFELQNDEMNKLLLDCCNCYECVLPIDKKVQNLQRLQNQIEATILFIYHRLIDIENKIVLLEKCSCSPNVPKDVNRKQIYDNVEEINNILLNVQQTLFLLELNYCVRDIGLHHHFEELASLLCCQLQQLETIDAKIQELQNKLVWCNRCNSRICSLRRHWH